MTDLDPSAGGADDAGASSRRGRARSNAEGLGNADAERRAAGISVRWLPVESLTPDPENVRVHGPRQIARIADSIAAFGFNVPILIDATAPFWRAMAASSPPGDWASARSRRSRSSISASLSAARS
jgi:hypothetical protein